MHRGLAKSVVLALVCAGICPAPAWTQPAAPDTIHDAAARAANPWSGNLIPAGQDRNGLQLHVADDPRELKPNLDSSDSAAPSREIQVDHIPLDASQPGAAATDVSGATSPATQQISLCAPSAPLRDRHVLGAVTVARLIFNSDLRLAPGDQHEMPPRSNNKATSATQMKSQPSFWKKSKPHGRTTGILRCRWTAI